MCVITIELAVGVVLKVIIAHSPVIWTRVNALDFNRWLGRRRYGIHKLVSIAYLIHFTDIETMLNTLRNITLINLVDEWICWFRRRCQPTHGCLPNESQRKTQCFWSVITCFSDLLYLPFLGMDSVSLNFTVFFFLEKQTKLIKHYLRVRIGGRRISPQVSWSDFWQCL